MKRKLRLGVPAFVDLSEIAIYTGNVPANDTNRYDREEMQRQIWWAIRPDREGEVADADHEEDRVQNSVRVPSSAPVRAEGKRFLIDGEPVALYSGAVHYWRLDRDKWPDILDKVIGMGFNAITTYIPWETHELRRGEFDFGQVDPRNDIDAFISLCEEKNLYVIPRPGPQINSEMTCFGYPLRILDDAEMQARTSQGAKAILTQVPRPIPAISYASEKFLSETALWYDAICEILARHVYPKGNVVAVQVDNEMAYFFHVNPYQCDYSDPSVAAYQRFLEEKYGSLDVLNAAYHKSYTAFPEVDPPRRFEGKTRQDIPYYTDWAEYREVYLIESMTRLSQMLRDRGIIDVPIFHNYPHPLGPGGSASGITTPFNLKALEEKIDFVGFDIYSRRELYEHVKTVVSYVVGTSRYPFIPEFVAGVWPWYLRPGNEYDEEFVTKAAIMNGIKGSSRYMIVERNRWLASPVMRDGTVRPERYDVFRKANDMMNSGGFAEIDRRADILLLANRQYDRLEAASVLVSFPGDFLEPILGFSEYPNYMATSEETFGFKEPIQQAKSDWFKAMADALGETGYDYLLGDTAHSVAEFLQYKAVMVSAFEFMDAKVQTKLLDAAKGGVHVILGPELPQLDELLRPNSPLADALVGAVMTPVSLAGADIADAYAVGTGQIIHLLRGASEQDRLADSLIELLSGTSAMRIRKSDVRIDTTLHQGSNPRWAVLFVANPKDQTIDVRLTLDRKVQSATELWENQPEQPKDGSLEVSMPPYSIHVYSVTFA